MQAGYQWPWFILILLRLLFIAVPLLFIVVLQNFYIQSVIFATERATAINRDEGGPDPAAEQQEEADPQQLWQTRLVRLLPLSNSLCNVSRGKAVCQTP